ncbi:MAG: hypothetical protein WD623_13270 [Marinobacter sp.]|uniref:hypothetical protein n=1 Tax=Marinobacter sp. TaxID=50741 RepID=UPI0034A023C4
MTIDIPDAACAASEQKSQPAQPSPAASSALRQTPLHQHGISAYWLERRDYLARVRKVPELRQRYWRAVAIYTLRRTLWSFGFFPVFIAFWVPLVLSNFNPVILVNDVLPALQTFVGANPEVQANTLSTLIAAWLSVGFFFLVFDFVLTPFKSPYQYEADVHMRAWEQLNHDRLPAKVL